MDPKDFLPPPPWEGPPIPEAFLQALKPSSPWEGPAPEMEIAVEKAYTRMSRELAAHGIKAPEVAELSLPRIARELGMDWQSPEFKRLVEKSISAGMYRSYPSGVAANNIYITLGARKDVAVAGLTRRPGQDARK